MLQRLLKKSDRVFNSTKGNKSATVSLAQQRKKIAMKLNNPRIAKIHFHLIRHWKATMEYHKIQNIIQVQCLLGHKSIFKVSSKLIGMLRRLPKKSDRVFNSTKGNKSVAVTLAKQRKKIAIKLGNPRIAKIHFHLIRHLKATMEYHKTSIIIQVQAY
jgi:integrase